MGAKESLLKDIHTLITTKFKSPEEAFLAFDKDKDGSLNKDEIKELLKEAGINSFLRGLVAGEMIKGYDKSGDEKMNKEEFKVAIAELNRDY
ncbi:MULTISPECIES: EF-hand domain-containing protein [unclassified Polaribacter]|uniref:EF-hand domain-containing protein n=1 Tax=unclassified Polaribacter TaxID=196858 RepID=UPI0011BDC9FB|nr:MULTISPECIES: EF-hand domain-containing protein [unclassified Polaribacter]TXD54177.1 EF-hand domain-containing protein [Polaribacter sp. IC063]TXD62442.1 EF-hand domain-containing protein [Polaribacter sp. IC066]